MTWIGYTTHHLAGNISILLLILLFWWFNRTNKTMDDSLKSIIITIIIAFAFVLTTIWALYLKDNPEEVIKLF